MSATMLRAACYSRYSSEMQRETSLDDQIASVRRFVHTQGWTLTDDNIFTDSAISGASLDRPGMQRLLARAMERPRPYDVLVVDDSSRVSRDLADALRVVQQLKFWGVRVIFVSQGIDSDHEQFEVLLTVHGLIDGLYVREMAAKIKRGLRGQLARGFSTGSITFGWRTVPVPDPSGKLDPNGGPRLLGKEIELVPEQAQVIRQIFELFVQGLGLTTICDRLNTYGAVGPRGGRWKRGAVRRVLVNERYLGRLIWGERRFERVPGSRAKAVRAVPRSDWHVLERPDLQVVTPELWDAAQQRFREVRSVTATASDRPLMRGRNAALHSPNLFSGFMRCGICGGSVTAVCSGKGSPRYGCARSWRNGVTDCPNRLTVRVKVVDPLLLEQLREQLLAPETIAYLSTALTTALNQTIDERPRLLAQARTTREETAQRLQRLVDAIESGIAPLTLAVKINAREAELTRLDADIAALSEPVEPKLAIIPSWVEAQLRDLASLLSESPERVKLEFRRLQLAVVMLPVEDEGTRAFYRASGSAQLSALSGSTDVRTPTVRSKGRAEAAKSWSPAKSIGQGLAATGRSVP
jgi:DNA invertase Pin-like site-specific DNA recombinase